MNIREAKEEIIRTVNAYRRKDETGAYEIPPEHQRPVLLMGPPGIGKTAVMEQIAESCGIGLVSYTITHHTRQSAIGLPMIAHRKFGDKDCAVTEYTMSEIVASVYEQIEQTGISEGILFLDEINCVSETLAPTMLQFLQYKTFGTHKVPDGWLIVTAGNPPQYNRSAREFDIVTLDRVKKMEIEADFAVWKEYAYRAGVHGAVLSYLDVKQQNFYVIRTELDGRHFVTARGWEDLSRMLGAYEKMGEEVTEEMVIQYIQDAEIAKDFAMYYALYRKYSELYHIDQIYAGSMPSGSDELRDIPFDEKLSLIRLLVDGLHREFMQFEEDRAVQEQIYQQLLAHKTLLGGADRNGAVLMLRETGTGMRRELKRKSEASMISREAARVMRLTCKAWDELTEETAAAGAGDPFETAKAWFSAREDARLDRADNINLHLTNAFSFLSQVYGTGQELVMFLTELNTDWYCLQYIDACGNEAYERYNKLLLLRDRREALRRDIVNMTL